VVRIPREAICFHLLGGLFLISVHAEEFDCTDNHQFECRGVFSGALTAVEQEETVDSFDT